ncbi:hypothetical protein GCM10027578_40500 [Spirosoma luteolum]
MQTTLLTLGTLFCAAAAFGQNTVSISQSGAAGNSASVTQSGEGNTVSISQSGGGSPTDASQPGNRVSLRVTKGTQTTIEQRSRGDGPFGPNSVEISQEGLSTATISQSSDNDQNTITTLPEPTPARAPRRRPTRRGHRRP